MACRPEGARAQSRRADATNTGGRTRRDDATPLQSTQAKLGMFPRHTDKPIKGLPAKQTGVYFLPC